jgi:hypothetical protein
MLSRRTRTDREELVTTRPAARPPDKIHKMLRWALALAPRGRSSCTRSGRVVRQRGRCLLPALAITPTLRTPALLPLLRGPIVATGIPASPAPSCLPATCTAVATLRMARPEPAFTAFQETASASKPPPRLLIGLATATILRWAQGRLYSRRSSLGGEWRLCSEALSLYRILPAYRRGQGMKARPKLLPTWPLQKCGRLRLLAAIDLKRPNRLPAVRLTYSLAVINSVRTTVTIH